MILGWAKFSAICATLHSAGDLGEAKMFKCIAAVTLSFVSAFAQNDQTHSPLVTVRIEPRKFAAGAVQSGTVAFLTDHSLVVSVCNLPWCELHTFKIEEGKLREVAELPVPDSFGEIFRGPNGSLILEHLYGQNFEGAVQLDLELKGIQVLSKVWLNRDCISSTGRTFVNQVKKDHWIAYRTSKPQDSLREGDGRMVSVTDDEVIFEANETLFIETMDGKRLGSFATGYAHWGMVRGRVTLLGSDRVLIGTAVRGLNGKSQVQFPKQIGAGYPHHTSEDGRIVLFDESIRRLSPMKAFGEAATLAALDAPDNTEIIRVVNGTNGQVCFREERKLDQLLSGLHSAIDDTGKKIAILEPSGLSIYELPSSCSAAKN